MPSKKHAHAKPQKKTGQGTPAGTAVVCWEDDPGDPKSQPVLAPIPVPVPNQSAQPLPYKLAGKAPAPQIYQPGTISFVYYATAGALRRTADFWGSILPAGTRWQVGSVLPVNIDSGVDLNAFYTRGDIQDTPGLHFFHQSVAGRVYYSGESPDVCCHEMGHAVLDALRPQLYDAQTIEAAAFHESFGDMSALLSALQVPSFRQAVMTDTGGTVNHASRLSRLAEQLGAAIRFGHPDAVDPDCLRNAANSFFYTDPQALPPNAPASQLSSEPHSFSRVFTGAFLDGLAGVFRLQDQSSDGLLQATQVIAQLLVTAIQNAAVVPDYYSQVAAHLVQAGEAPPFSGKYRDVLKSTFVRRGILSLQAATTLSGLARQTAKAMAMTATGDQAPIRTRTLPVASISAAAYGLKSAVLKVHTASEPKPLAVTGSAFLTGPADARSAHGAAESYTEDLFQRGHVSVGKHAHESAGLVHPYAFKTHVVVEENGDLTLRRTTFDCGYHFAFDQRR